MRVTSPCQRKESSLLNRWSADLTRCARSERVAETDLAPTTSVGREPVRPPRPYRDTAPGALVPRFSDELRQASVGAGAGEPAPIAGIRHAEKRHHHGSVGTSTAAANRRTSSRPYRCSEEGQRSRVGTFRQAVRRGLVRCARWFARHAAGLHRHWHAPCSLFRWLARRWCPSRCVGSRAASNRSPAGLGEALGMRAFSDRFGGCEVLVCLAPVAESAGGSGVAFVSFGETATVLRSSGLGDQLVVRRVEWAATMGRASSS